MFMSSDERPVGVLDSGVGGISTLRELIRVLPGENFIYYGDMANAPYGNKSKEEVIACVRNAVNHLIGENIKALVLACNTATGAAAATLRAELSIPVIGMEPALKPASEIRENGCILVLATALTLQTEKFNLLMNKYGNDAIRVPCPGLMELVENNDGNGASVYLRKLFSAYDLDRVDAVVLGCTHYVFLKDMIREMLPAHIALMDGNEGTARQLRRILTEKGLLRDGGTGRVTLETSGTADELLLMKKLLSTGKVEMN